MPDGPVNIFHTSTDQRNGAWIITQYFKKDRKAGKYPGIIFQKDL